MLLSLKLHSSVEEILRPGLLSVSIHCYTTKRATTKGINTEMTPITLNHSLFVLAEIVFSIFL